MYSISCILCLLQASPSHLLLFRFPGFQISLSLSLSSFFGCCIVSLFLSSDVISSLSISHHPLFLRVRSLSSFFDHAYISVSSWVIRREERITLVRVCVFFLRIKDETRRALPLIVFLPKRT